MRDRTNDIERLADLLVGFGANVQRGDIVAVSAYLGMEELARAVARSAYRRGAKWVDVLWFDLWVKRARLLYSEEEFLDYVPPWLGQRLYWLSDERAARVSLVGSDPRAFEGVDPARAGRDVMPYLKETPEVVNRQTTSWTAAPCPLPGWAEQVHPELPPDEALDRLWDEIVFCCRLDADDPIAAWRERMAEITSVAARLTERRFDALRFRGPGTDLTIGLLPSSTWLGASLTTVDGRRHHPNLPSEEIFTTPDPERVDGYVTGTRPLEFYGSLIDGIRVRFEGGRAVEIDADQGADALRALAGRDAGASRLGEVALVDREGRVGQTGTVFHETLLDENAASHIALGNAYPFPVADPADRERINVSGLHADFMIGSTEVDVEGITRDGERVPVLSGGDWQL